MPPSQKKPKRTRSLAGRPTQPDRPSNARPDGRDLSRTQDLTGMRPPSFWK